MVRAMVWLGVIWLALIPSLCEGPLPGLCSFAWADSIYFCLVWSLLVLLRQCLSWLARPGTGVGVFPEGLLTFLTYGLALGLIWAGCGRYVGHCDIVVGHCDIAVVSLIIRTISEICHWYILWVGFVIFPVYLHRVLDIGTCRALMGWGVSLLPMLGGGGIGGIIIGQSGQIYSA